MICIYHNKDLDGYCSGAIVKLKYPDCKMIGYDYGQPLELDITGEPIIMVDVSVPMTTMKKLSQLSNHQLTWIDHHASAIKDYNEYIEIYAQGNQEAIKIFCTAIFLKMAFLLAKVHGNIFSQMNLCRLPLSY